MTKFDYILDRLKNLLWLWPTIMSLIAVGWVLGAYGFQYYVAEDWPINIEKETLTNLFAILASTMLTVATFAVSVLVAAFTSISSNTTPRARVLVMSDGTAQTALASFVGAFIYAVVALVALSALSYGRVGRFGLFVGFVITVSFVLMSFLRWVALVSNLGALDDTIDRAEAAALRVFSSADTVGGLGGREYPPEKTLPDGQEVHAPEIGYLCHVDVSELDKLAEHHDAEMWLHVRPGTFVDTATPLVSLVGGKKLTEEDEKAVLKAFTIGQSRNFSADPRFALIVLSEIADRALSPSTNDPGTTIRIIGVQVRLFARWVETRSKIESTDEVDFPRIHVPALAVPDLLSDAFMPMSRSGAHFLEVAIRLQKGFRALANLGRDDLREAARFQASLALEQSLEKITLQPHRENLERVALR